MSYFDSKDRTVFSPQVDVLDPLYEFLEKYHKAFSGSNFFDELIETYESLDYALKEKEEETK